MAARRTHARRPERIHRAPRARALRHRVRAAARLPGSAAAFLAVSPPAVYYSRYFIQETLLVTFTLAALVCAARWWHTGRIGWAIATGACAGLMQATKASAPLFLAAAAVALVCSARRDEIAARVSLRALAAAAIAAGVMAALLYSSFFTNPGGLRDALAAYAHALTRFGAEAPPTGHEKPWWYYLKLFGWYREGGMVWHQLAFSTLAVAGLVIAAVRWGTDRLLRGTAIYALVVVGAFSVFAYKTPWHAVHFVAPLALLAGASVAAIARLNTGRPVAVAFTLIVVATLFQQSQRVAFARPADQRNPYAYVHSTPDILKIRALAEAAVARAPDRPIRVIAAEYWPLPWYLRGFPQVGYYAEPPAECDGALVIVSADLAEAVRARLTGPYRTTFLGLRPGVVCILFAPDL